ncbi:tapasin isoform X2 [Anolis carolinensis]|uniref:tapasin isoform X2 n=1 Tax=Anolis carolinensis TaxID=28377 RepID=UPI002F2B22DD
MRLPHAPRKDGALILSGAASSSSPSSSSSVSPLSCWFVEEGSGGGSVMPSALSQRPALLLLGPPGRGAGGKLGPGQAEALLPPQVQPGMAFHVVDPSGTLWSKGGVLGGGGGGGDVPRPIWLQPSPSHQAEEEDDEEEEGGGSAEGVSCEVNPYSPQEAHVSWAAGLGGEEGCPRSLDGKWFIASLRSPTAGYGVSAIMHASGLPSPSSPRKHQEEASVVTTATVVLSVFTRTPLLSSRLGQDVLLDCGFSGPSGVPFSVEWRHQHGGAGRVVLAYDGAAPGGGRVSVAEEGARLFLDPSTGNASLQLRAVGPHHEGIYICTLFLPHLHAQQAARLRVLEPPRVSLRPSPLVVVAPNSPAELSCEVSGHFPQGASVTWGLRGGSLGGPLQSWESGHHQSPEGTFRFTSFARLPPLRPQDHGASVECRVSHPALGEGGLHQSVTIHIAGSSGPSVEDAVGCFLIAFALYGLLQAFFQKVFPEKQATEKTKSEKLE